MPPKTETKRTLNSNFKSIPLFPFISFHRNKSFDDFIKKISADVHLVSPDSDDLQLVIDNEGFLEVDSYSEALFALVGVHYVFNLEYPKKLKYVYQLLDEYVFGIPPPKKYHKGVSTFLVDAP